MHASAQEALQREAANNHGDFANIMIAKQEADRQVAQATFLDTQLGDSLKEEDFCRRLTVLKAAHEVLDNKGT